MLNPEITRFNFSQKCFLKKIYMYFFLKFDLFHLRSMAPIGNHSGDCFVLLMFSNTVLIAKCLICQLIMIQTQAGSY